MKSQPPTKKRKQAQQQEQFLKTKESDPRLVHLQNQIGKTKGVKDVSAAVVDKSGSAASFSVIPTTAPAADSTADLVNDLRDTVIPKADQGTTLTTYVGGQTASYIDLASRISEKLPLVIAVVIALSLILLLIAFRSVIVPITSALMNLLSVGASYGVLTFVFQEGHGASLLGVDGGATPIVSYVPLMMFAILFGLSMDYQVFLLSRIREHYRGDGGQPRGGRRRAGRERAGDRVGGADHGLRLHELHPQRPTGGQGVWAGLGGRDRDRRNDRAVRARAIGDGAARKPQLVAAAPTVAPAACGHRGRGVLQGPRCHCRGRGAGRRVQPSVLTPGIERQPRGSRRGRPPGPPCGSLRRGNGAAPGRISCRRCPRRSWSRPTASRGR